MLRENRVFAQERLEYQKIMDTGGIYCLGSFIPKDIKNINHSLVQMVPTKNSALMFNTVRNALGYNPFEEDFEQDSTMYTDSGITSKFIVDKIYGSNTTITNITTEFLDIVGLYSGLHSIRLVELTEDNTTYFYVLVGGKGALEAKADEMYNAKSTFGDCEPFQKTGNKIVLDSISFVDLAISMANELFNRNWTVNDPISTEPLHAVNTPNAIDTEEFTKWSKLDSNSNWMDAIRLGAVFAIKKKSTKEW